MFRLCSASWPPRAAVMMRMTRARQAAQEEEARSAASARVFACGPFVALLLAKLDAYALARFSAVNKAARDEVRANVDAQKLLEEFEEELEEKWDAMHAAESCPWGWCKGNLHLHNNVLCMPSKGTYGISWAFNMSRRMLIDQHGVDIWIRRRRGVRAMPGGEGECKRGSREGWTDGEVVMTSLRLLI